jgi:hypothetical protein
MIEETVNKLMRVEPWKSDPLVQRLGLRRGAAAFSNPKASVGYITGLLRRLNLRRRRAPAAVIQGMPPLIARGDGAVDPDSEEPDADTDAEALSDAADSDTDGSDQIEN